MACAQQPGAEVGDGQRALGARLYVCVDLSDALAHRRLQHEACKLPLYELPRPEAPGLDGLPRGQSGSPGAPARVQGHAMFWRFPVQGHGPHEVPRHTWR